MLYWVHMLAIPVVCFLFRKGNQTSCQHDVAYNCCQLTKKIFKCCRVKDNKRSGDITNPNSISNDVEIGTPINENGSIDHHSPADKSDASLEECWIISSASSH